MRSAGTRPWSSSAGGPQLARQAEQLVHRLRREALGLGELGGELRRRALGGRREAHRDRGQRLVDLVVQVAGQPRALGLLRAQDGRGGGDALGLQPDEHDVEGLAQAGDVGRLVVGGLRARAGDGEVDALHRARQRLQRLEAPAHDEVVGEDRDEHRRGEHEQRARLGRLVAVEVRADGDRRDRRSRR